MNKPMSQKPVIETSPAAPRATQPKAYEAPRITRKQSLERVTLASGVFAPNSSIGGN